jgi:Pin2-interacting protein X1
VAYKDDNLGLGASHRSANPEQNLAALDAFQGLLGRLNSKDEAEVKKLEQRSEDRKLARWTQGRWGGVMFVPGGVLVQGDKFKSAENDGKRPDSSAEEEEESPDLKAARNAAEVLRKAERQARKEAKLSKRAKRSIPDSVCDAENKIDDPTHKAAEYLQSVDRQKRSTHQTDNINIGSALSSNSKQKKRKTAKSKHRSQSDEGTATVQHLEAAKVIVDTVQLPTPPSDSAEMPVSTQAVQSGWHNGRHLLRGRNIQAKRMAFADAKMLDEVRRFCSDSAKVSLTNNRSS